MCGLRSLACCRLNSLFLFWKLALVCSMKNSANFLMVSSGMAGLSIYSSLALRALARRAKSMA